ncbi:alanine:cation symporter family protein [Candidatus Poribacteria bacterium]|nr:alanine:cation symporter family protein [Candidatus Poribacteria bacterium]
MQQLEKILIDFGNVTWGPWLLVLLLGGGAFFLCYSRFLPFRYIRHAVDILRGKYDDPSDPGDISHFAALSSALAATIGVGNIAGVAVAVKVGGPGAIFWMWLSAVVGMATKFFTCTLAIMYRGTDSRGTPQGGPMYSIVEGLGQKWRPLGAFFCVAALIGALPAFQVNQLVQIVRDVIFVPNGWVGESHFTFDLIAGIIIAGSVALIIFGGILRIGTVASKLVPGMLVLYMAAAVWILAVNYANIPKCLWLIITDAFSGQAVAGGAIGAVIMTGIRRAAYSNEAGIGTAALAHGAAKTTEPVREGLIAMLGPAIDTLIVCTVTALIILTSGVWQSTEANGITLTVMAFNKAMPGIGPYLLTLCVLCFSTSTMFAYSYYGTKCMGFLIGAERQHIYNYFYVALMVVAAVVSLDAAISLIDGAFALMAIPTMISTILLAPKVMQATRTYLDQYKDVIKP